MDEYAVDIIGLDKVNSIELITENAIDLNYKINLHCECDGFVREINVDASYLREDEDEDSTTCGEEILTNIGRIEIKVLRLLSLLNYNEAFEYCDILSQNFVDGFTGCFKKEDSKNKTKWSLERIEEYVYIDEVRIENSLRNSGNGSAIIREIIDTIGNRDSLFVVIPFAIEDSNNPKAHKRVKSFWMNLGFRKMPNTRFYVYHNSFEYDNF